MRILVAFPNLDVNKKNINSLRTVLHDAVIVSDCSFFANQGEEMVKLLLQVKTIDVTIRNALGITALETARNPAVIALLEAKEIQQKISSQGAISSVKKAI